MSLKVIYLPLALDKAVIFTIYLILVRSFLILVAI